MSHGAEANLNIDAVIAAGPLQVSSSLRRVMWYCVYVGMAVFVAGLVWYPHDLLWGAYYTNLLFFMGLAAGGVVISVIFQIVRATWSVPIRRLTEANVAFLPWALILLAGTYWGKEYLFAWGRGPMPGKEWWMQADFVYARHLLCMGFLFFLFWHFVRLNLRGDIGLAREKSGQNGKWLGWLYQGLTKNWRGTAAEVKEIQPRLSRLAPVVIFFYATIYSLFSFEFIMNMDMLWISNLFGGFNFIGNIYVAWAVLAMLVIYMAKTNSAYNSIVSTNQLWDLGKLTFGFCMLWGYFFFSQFLPQWYGNMPEETQWMILRTREYPWKSWGWFVFPMCFVIPFILLLSRDLKKTPAAYATVCLIIFLGIWMEKYLVVMPQISPSSIPFGVMELGLFLGFLGAYVLSILGFLSKFPFAHISSPLAKGHTDW